MLCVQGEFSGFGVLDSAILVDETLVGDDTANYRVCVAGVPVKADAISRGSLLTGRLYLHASYTSAQSTEIQSPELSHALSSRERRIGGHRRSVFGDARVLLLHDDTCIFLVYHDVKYIEEEGSHTRMC